MDASADAWDLRCLVDNVQGMADALTCLRWKKQQCYSLKAPRNEKPEHLIPGCYMRGVGPRLGDYGGRAWVPSGAGILPKRAVPRIQAEIRPKFGVSLGLLIDSLNTFTSCTGTTALEICYPGPDMQMIFKLVDANDSCMYAEIRTRIPDIIHQDYVIEDNAGVPISFAVKSAALKEALDDLEWPGSSIDITVTPVPPVVTFKGEGHGDLQIGSSSFLRKFHDARLSCLLTERDLFIAFNCDREISHRYKYKFLRATTSQIPGSILKDNRGSKITFGSSGLLKVQHLISVKPTLNPHQHYYDLSQAQARVSYIEFYVLPEAESDDP